MARRALIATLAALIVLMALTVLTAIWPSKVYAQEYPATIIPHDPGLIVIPEWAEVDDGGSVVFDILRPMF